MNSFFLKSISTIGASLVLINLSFAGSVTINNLGTKTAGDLNNRFQNTPLHCNSNNKPGYYCSGIMIRTVDRYPEKDSYSWQAPTYALGNTIAFTYIRKDITNASKSIWHVEDFGSGLIVNDENTALQKNTGYGVGCIFPTNAVSNERPHGCGDSSKKNDYTDYTDYSTCHLKGIYTDSDWYNKYVINGAVAEVNSCSFGAQDFLSFNHAISTQNLIHKNLSSDDEYKFMWNELPVTLDTWDQENPINNSIEAFWYNPNTDTSQGMGLVHAQKDQKEYYALYHVNIPIVRLDTNSSNTPFSYFILDQGI
ncbi:MAG: hypothetical protein ACI9P5_004786 [Saprospiraceae bacterium]|jgi:hypothetical protein